MILGFLYNYLKLPQKNSPRTILTGPNVSFKSLASFTGLLKIDTETGTSVCLYYP